MESNGMAGAVCISEQTYKLINKNKVIAEIFDFKEHRSCSIDTIGKNIKSYIVSQNLNAMGESSEDYSEDGAEEDYEDGEQHSDNSQSNEGYEHDLYSASRQSMSNPDDSIRQDSEKLWLAQLSTIKQSQFNQAERKSHILLSKFVSSTSLSLTTYLFNYC